MIIILSTTTMASNDPVTRTAHIWISDGSSAFIGNVPGLPATGNLQTILNSNEVAIWGDLSVSGSVPTATEAEIVAAIQWYIANPGTATAVFGKTTAQEVTDVTAMLLILFPGNTAPIIAARTGMLQLLLSSLWDTRVNARERGLI